MPVDVYPIRAVAKLTGISLDTLRAWERRYGVVEPEQGPRGRLYSGAQVQRLSLLREAVESGYSIGQIANDSDAHIKGLLKRGHKLSRPAREASQPRGSDGSHSKELLASLLEAVDHFDYAASDREMNRLAAALGSPRNFVHQVALPLMQVVGTSWHEGRLTIGQEHMVTALLSNLLASLIRIYTPAHPPAKVLLATPAGERHGFPTLAAAMLAAAGGLGTIYLGTELPGNEIVYAQKKTGADAILLSLMHVPEENVRADLHLIERKSPSTVSLWLGGPELPKQLRKMRLTRFLPLHDFHLLESQLMMLGAKF